MDEEDMYIVNEDTLSRMGEIGQNSSNIDLIFTSRGIIDKIQYEQEEDNWGSDHFPIRATIQIEYEKNQYTKVTNRISRKKTNWGQYKTELDRIIRRIREKKKYLELNVIDKYNYIIKYFTKVMKIANSGREEEGDEREDGDDSGVNVTERVEEKEGQTMKKDSKVRGAVEWWDKDCKEAVEKRKKKLKNFLVTVDMKDFIEYKRQKAETTKLIKKKKKKNLINLVEGINRNTSLKYLHLYGTKWKYLKTGSKK